MFAGNATVFPAFNGVGTTYAGMNFNSTTGAGTISTWLMSPQRTFANGDTISFYTRKATPAPTDFPDRLYLKLSQNGASTTPADFSVTLVSVNPTLVAGGYPVVWAQFTATISGLAAPTSGRFAFDYNVTDGGPAGNNSDYIGIDAVVYTQNVTNTAPTITAAAVSQAAGANAASQSIANVSDPNQAAATLAVTVNGGASATVNGVTVSNPVAQADGSVLASVNASCLAAASAGFTLSVTDAAAASTPAQLTVTVPANVAPTLTYPSVVLSPAAGTTVNPATGPSDSGAIGSISVQSQGTYGGSVSVDAMGVVSLGAPAPAGTHQIIIRATDNCSAQTDATLNVEVLTDGIFINGFET